MLTRWLVAWRSELWRGAVLLCIALPWLNPFSPGPSSAAAPLLFAWACAALLLGLLALTEVHHHTPGTLLSSVALAWLVAALLSALIGILQYFSATAWLGQWANQGLAGEAFGNLRQRNQFATLLNIGLAALLWWGSFLPPKGALGSAGCVLQRSQLLSAALLLGVANAASSSRTGLLELLLLLGLTLWWWRWRAHAALRQTLLVVLLAYGLALLLLPWLIGHDPATSGALARLRAGDALCASRLTLWGNVLHLIAQRPWLGWGWGELDYAHFITLYPSTRFCDILDNAHNLPLHLAVELGVPLALATLVGVCWLVWRARPWAERVPSRQLAWTVLALIGLHSMLEYPLWYGPFQLAALLSVWFLLPPAARSLGLGANARRCLALALASALLLFCALAAWNYRLASQIYLPLEERAPAYRENTLEQVGRVWLFGDQQGFAELTTTDLNLQNAAAMRTLALDMLHFSPEARVIEVLLESSALLGQRGEVDFYAARFQAAFPTDYARWQHRQCVNSVAQRCD